jgi:hypothetical protein
VAHQNRDYIKSPQRRKADCDHHGLEDGILDENPPHVELTGAVLARSLAHQQLRVDIDTKNNVAPGFIKPLEKEAHERFIHILCLN